MPVEKNEQVGDKGDWMGVKGSVVVRFGNVLEKPG